MKKVLDSDIKRQSIDLGSLFDSPEALLACYYGRIGQGKTYALTADVIEYLKQGVVVYANYPIDWKGYNQTSNFISLFFGLIGLKTKFYKFLPNNLHSITVDENFHKELAKLTDCVVALDEGYVAFDSYEMAKMSMSKRQNVLHTRHFNRSILYTSQRPMAMHTSIRSQTNAFYKIVKKISWPFVLFLRQEFDLGSDERVDENKVFSRKWYFGKRKIFNCYDTKYLRGDTPKSQKLFLEVLKPSYSQIVKMFFSKFDLTESKIWNSIFKKGRKNYKHTNSLAQNVSNRIS